MKKLYLIAVLAILSLTSCADFLDKESDTESTIDEVFESRILQERWLGYCYSKIPDPYWFMINSDGRDVLADDTSPSERWQQWGWNTIPWRAGNVNASSGWGGDYWAAVPRRQREALIFMERAKAVPEDGLFDSEVQLMKLECRALIAYYYWLFAEAYGPCPFTPGGYLAPTEFDLETLMEGPKPWDTIVDWVDQELLELSNLLPDSYTSSQKFGRFTGIMCLAVRARMLLFNASPLVNGNPDYKDHTDRQGNPLFPQTYDANKWKRAADACKLLIDRAHAAGHELFVKYNADGTIDPFSSCQLQYIVTNAADNKEILFGRADCDYGSMENHSHSSDGGGNNGLGVTQEFVDAHFMANGLPINAVGSGYVEEGFSTEDDIRPVDWEYGQPNPADKHSRIIAHKGTYNMYVNREPRFYCNVNYHGAWSHSMQRYFDFLSGHVDNSQPKGHHDAPQSGYLLKKRVNPNFYRNHSGSAWRPGILYRLGEAYLNYAEALNEVGGHTDEVLEYVNKIRERAGIRGYHTGATNDEYIHVDDDQAAIRDIIKAERRIELGCEGGLRYADLRRWKECEKYLDNQWHHGMNFKADTQEDFFQRVTYESKRVFKKALYWIPIYQTEVDKNPNLVQAPFWETTADED